MINTKKIIIFTLIIALGIINFYTKWYNGILFERFPIFCLLLTPIKILLNIMLIIMIFKNIISKNFFQNILFILLCFFTIFINFISWDIIKVKKDLNDYKEKYIEVIKLVEEKKLYFDEDNFDIILPKNYENLSVSGTIKSKSKAEVLIVGFWVYRGLFIGESMVLIYISNDDINSLLNDYTDVQYVKKIDNNWYLIKG